MTSFIILLTTVATMFIYIAVGYGARLLGFIDDVGTKKMTRFILNVAQPFMIVNAVISNEYSSAELKSGLIVFGIGLIVHTTGAVIAFFATLPIKDGCERRVCEDSMIFANCGFFGFPLVEALFGSRGLFWGAFYVISFNIVCWTYGLFVLSRAKSTVKMKPLKMILNSGTVPCMIGIVLYLLRVQLPDFVLNAVRGMTGICTPATLAVAGALLANIPIKKLFTRPVVYYCSAVKMIVIPIISSLILKLLGFGTEYVIFGATMASLPTAAIIAMFAESYEINPGLAAHNVGMSTLLTVMTIPAVTALVGLFA